MSIDVGVYKKRIRVWHICFFFQGLSALTAIAFLVSGVVMDDMLVVLMGAPVSLGATISYIVAVMYNDIKHPK